MLSTNNHILTNDVGTIGPTYNNYIGENRITVRIKNNKLNKRLIY